MNYIGGNQAEVLQYVYTEKLYNADKDIQENLNKWKNIIYL
jgi:hypothetical protein